MCTHMYTFMYVHICMHIQIYVILLHSPLNNGCLKDIIYSKYPHVIRCIWGQHFVLSSHFYRVLSKFRGVRSILCRDISQNFYTASFSEYNFSNIYVYTCKMACQIHFYSKWSYTILCSRITIANGELSYFLSLCQLLDRKKLIMV